MPPSKKAKVSTREETEASIKALLDAVPAEQLAGTVADVQVLLNAARDRLKIVGKDTEFERHVSKAMKSIAMAYDEDDEDYNPPDRYENHIRKEAVRLQVRNVLARLKIKKAASTDKGGYPGRHRGARFQIEFAVGGASGFIHGTVTECEVGRGEYYGNCTSSFLGDDHNYDEDIRWDSEEVARVKKVAFQWLEAVGLGLSRSGLSTIDWRDASLAVAAGVLGMASLEASKSKSNDAPWAFEFLRKRIRDQLTMCPRDVYE